MAKYPLEAARTLRAEELDAATTVLAQAVDAETKAEAQVARCRQALADHRAATEQAKASEGRLEARSVADLQQGQAYLRRRRAEDEALQERVDAAMEAHRKAQANVETARAALADARAQKEAVEKHFARWKAAQRAAAEKRAEDEADDRASATHKK